jgi:threonine dehydrogenase-like Zn-dependent dehydrogenase
MRAVVMRNHSLVVDDVPTPKPGPGEVLVKTLACGICGTDLHALKHSENLSGGSRASGGIFAIDPTRDVVMGHEFCAEVVEYGPGTRKRFKAGTRVCSIPALKRSGVHGDLGYSSENPGGFGEMMRLSEDNLLGVPKELSPEVAAITEVLAVAYHALAMARLERRSVPLVIGCGPVGLSIIATLKANGMGPIIAAELSEGRRRLAARMGADIVIDPTQKSPYETFQLGELARRPSVIFECVGAPGVLDEIMFNAPRHARIIVLGLCMERDGVHLASAIHQELNLQFVFGCTSAELAAALRDARKRKLPLHSMITDNIGLDGVAKAFADLESPTYQGKIVVEPWRS